jgi:hypothetical protein
MVFPQRGGKLIKSLEILPSVTACRCSQRASIAPVGLIRCRVNERPRLFNEFDQTILKTQPLALERIRLASTLSADLADKLEKGPGVGHTPLYSAAASAQKGRGAKKSSLISDAPQSITCAIHRAAAWIGFAGLALVQ